MKTKDNPTISTPYRKMLLASLNESIEERLRSITQALSASEKGRLRGMDRLCIDLRTVLESIIDDRTATPDQLAECAKFSERVSKIDPRPERERARRARARGDGAIDLSVACSAGDGTARPSEGGDDPWMAPPPLPLEEAFGLVELRKPFEVFVRGNFELRPGANTRALVEAALDGRPATIENLKRLFFHLTNSFVSGGFALTDNPLHLEIKKILTEQGALPAPDPAEKTFGQKLLEELLERCD